MREERATKDGEGRHVVFSDEDPALYRYRLDVIWGEGPILTTIGLNPPGIALDDDREPVLQKLKRYARRLECGGCRMLNVFAWRTRDYRQLFTVDDPVGPENTLRFLQAWVTRPAVACWGQHM